MNGRRVRDIMGHAFEPGDYGKYPDGVWHARTPNGHLGNLSAHDVTEHEDGTISVHPSIQVTTRDPDTKTDIECWHGYLERGVWRLVE